MTTPVQGVDISIKEIGPDGHELRYVSRWMGYTRERGWFSASHLGQDHRSHSNEDAARRALAGWLRSQAVLLCPDDQVIEVIPGEFATVSAKEVEDRAAEKEALLGEPWDVPPAPSAAGLEDLL